MTLEILPVLFKKFCLKPCNHPSIKSPWFNIVAILSKNITFTGFQVVFEGQYFQVPLLESGLDRIFIIKKGNKNARLTSQY